ncbi:MAG: ribosome hibernation-promoting factor, HPF/YfiA family [Solirubrobacterales bacterium]|jgi:putative sigma-54 modulation protein
MRIEIRGRNIVITDEVRRQVALGMRPIEPQVAPQARCEFVLSEEANPAIADRFVAEATLHLKGVTLHAHEASPEMGRTIHSLVEDMRRQVKKYREKRRGRTRARRMAARARKGRKTA